MQESPTKESRFDVCAIPDGENVLHNIPQLKKVKAFVDYKGSTKGGLNQDKVIKYIVLLYSDDSPLSKKPLAPLEDRKYHAADMAGFKREKKTEDFREKIIEQLFLLNDEDVVNMVIEYLTMLHNDVWSEIVITQQELEEYRRIRIAPVSAQYDKDLIMAIEKKDKLRASCDDMIKKLKEYTDIFYGDHNDLKSKSKKQRITLESKAKSQ